MPGGRLAEGRVRGVCHPDVFLEDVHEIFVVEMIVAGGGALATNQYYHEDHVGSFNSVGRSCLPSCRAGFAAMLAIVIVLKFPNFLSHIANLDRFAALNRSEVLAGANFIALRRGSLHVVCAWVVCSQVVLFIVSGTICEQAVMF